MTMHSTVRLMLAAALASVALAGGCASPKSECACCADDAVAEGLESNAEAGATMNNPPLQTATRMADPGVDRLTAFLVGDFSSAEQAKMDPDYRPITLHTRRIWSERTDGVWLYVEQAMATAADKPYRQRVYHLTGDGGMSVRSDVYTLPGDALSYAGAWREPAKLWGVTPERLTLRDGCSISLKVLPDGTFLGGTSGTGCGSDLRGASYATSEAHIFADRMVTWDRGFDAEAKQVWGAEKGGYIFVKAKPSVW